MKTTKEKVQWLIKVNKIEESILLIASKIDEIEKKLSE